MCFGCILQPSPVVSIPCPDCAGIGGFFPLDTRSRVVFVFCETCGRTGEIYAHEIPVSA